MYNTQKRGKEVYAALCPGRQESWEHAAAALSKGKTGLFTNTVGRNLNTENTVRTLTETDLHGVFLTQQGGLFKSLLNTTHNSRGEGVKLRQVHTRVH